MSTISRLPAGTLWANAALFATVGVAFLVDPHYFYFYAVSRQSLETPVAMNDIRMVYGVANVALGLVAAFCAGKSRVHHAGLIVMSVALAVAMCMQILRLLDERSPVFFTYLSIVLELALLSVCLAAMMWLPRIAATVQEIGRVSLWRAPQRRWIYLLTALLAAMDVLSALRGGSYEWLAFVVVIASLAQFRRPTIVGWFTVLVGYGVALFTLLADIGLQLDDYGSPDHGYFDGWGMVFAVGGFAVVTAGLFLLVAGQFPGGQDERR